MFQLAPTKKPTTTGQLENLKNVFSATHASKPGQAPACFHSCVGRIRYLGVLLYDADQIPDALKVPDEQLVERQRQMILDPHDPKVVAAAKESGVPDGVITAAQQSPVYRYVKEWELALPLHPEYRTLPMLFYVPPLLPVLNATQSNGTQRVETDLFSSLESARVPIRYMSRTLSVVTMNWLSSRIRR